MRQPMAYQTYLHVIKIRGNTLRSYAGQCQSRIFTLHARGFSYFHDRWNGLLSEVKLTVLSYNERIIFKFLEDQHHLKDQEKQVCEFKSNYIIFDLDLDSGSSSLALERNGFPWPHNVKQMLIVGMLGLDL